MLTGRRSGARSRLDTVLWTRHLPVEGGRDSELTSNRFNEEQPWT